MMNSAGNTTPAGARHPVDADGEGKPKAQPTEPKASPMTETKTAADVLERAAELIEKPGAWTQDDYARTEEGITTVPAMGDAVCWCAVGAIWEAAGEYAQLEREAETVLRRVINAPVIAWNDEQGRTQPEVVAAFHQAAALARSESPQ